MKWRIAALAGIATGAIGVTALAGWILGISRLRSVLTGAVEMKINTAVCFVVTGAAVAIFASAPGRRWPRRVLVAASALAGLAGAATLAEWIFAFDLGIDELLARDVAGAALTVAPGRMAPNTALCFLLAAAALPLLAAQSKASGVAARILGSSIGVIGLLGVLGYLYGVPRFYGLAAGFTAMALPTSAAFVLLALAIVTARSDGGWSAMFVERSFGASVARRLIPLAVVSMALGGWLHMQVGRGPYGAEFGMAIVVIVNIVVFTVLTAWGARLLARAGDARTVAVASLAESEERFRAFFEQAAVGVAEVGLDGTFLRINQRFAEIAGHPRDELVEKTFQEITHPDDLTADLELIQALLGGEIDKYTMEKRYLRAEGSPVWVELTVSLVRHADGTPGYFIAAIQAIGRRKKAEAALTAAYAELERRVEQRTAELAAERDRLRQASAELRRINRELESFSYSVSHDLRAPLRALYGFSSVLLDRYGGRFDAKGNDFLLRIRNAAQRMSQLIDDLLELARLSRSEMHLRSIDLTAMARDILEDLRGNEPEREVEALVASNVQGTGDPALLEVVLRNLLSNAWKFTSKKPKASIEFGRTNGTYFVRDDGAGFDAHHAEKLFDAFQRLHTREEFEGNGVGLAIVQRIIQRHGGAIWAEAVPDRGATFFFTLAPDAARATGGP